MSTKLLIATPEDAARVLHLVSACHAETGIEMTDDERASALAPLLDGSVQGVVYLIGPPSSPVGYIAISFGYAISLGGIEGYIDEIFVRPAVRSRGLAGEALRALVKTLPKHGVKALRVRAGGDDRLFTRLRFAPAPRGSDLLRLL